MVCCGLFKASDVSAVAQCKCCGVRKASDVSAVAWCVCVCERCRCCVDCGVVYVSGVSAVVRARLQLFDEEPFAALSGKRARSRLIAHPSQSVSEEVV